MSLCALRLRRTRTTISSLISHHRSLPAISSSSPSSLLQNLIALSSSSSPTIPSQSRPFRSSAVSLSSVRAYNNSNDDDIKLPDKMFEGCDFNHWLITMDFPNDPKPTPEEMVETYVQTCAKGLGISAEEAKKKIYACSTSTYNGFQAVMTEEESEKFKDLPGVVFILPDSYIDTVNKEYGGDKYINGTIIPRPPPVQFGRSGGRFGDRNRNPDRQRYDRQGGPIPHRQGNRPYEPQGPMQGDGRNGAPQNYSPRPNYGPAGQGERRYSVSMNNTAYGPGGVGTNQGERRDPVPSHQGNYNQAERGNYYSQEQKDFPQGDHRDFAVPEQRPAYGPGGVGTNQAERRDPVPSHLGNYNQAERGNYYSQEQKDFPQRDRRDFAALEQRMAYGPGGVGTNQGERRDTIPSHQDNYNQAERGNYYSQELRDFPQGDRRDFAAPGQRTAYGPGGVGTNQGERRDTMASHQGNYNQAERGNYYSQELRDFPQGDRRDFAAPEQRTAYGPGGVGTNQGERRDTMASHQGNYNQAERGNYYSQELRDFPQGDRRDFAAPEQRMAYGPGGVGTNQGERRDPIPSHQGNYNQAERGNYYNQADRRDFATPERRMAYGPGGVGTNQGERRDPMHSHQGNYNQAERGNYYSQEQKDFLQGDCRDFAAPEQRDFRDNRNSPPHAGNYGQGAGGAHGHGPSGGYGQGAGGADGHGPSGGYRQGAGGAHGRGPSGGFGQGAGGSYGQGAGWQGAGGSYGQGAGWQGAGGSYGQGAGWQGAGGSYGQEAASGYGQQSASGYGQQAASDYGQQAASGYGQSFPGHGEDQRFSQVEQRNYAPVGQTRTDQWR